MICPKCHTPLEIQSSFCPQCGASLHRGGGRVLMVAAACVMVMIIGVYGYIKYQFGRPPEDVRPAPTPPATDATYSEEIVPLPPTQASSDEDGLSIGNTVELTLEDITGRQILVAPVLVLSPGWFAFPVRPCIGAAAWYVTLPSGQRLEVAGGILHGADPIGLWQITPGMAPTDLELTPWLPDQPLTWYPIDGDADSRRITAAVTEYLSDFARIAFNTENDAAGFFIQDNRLVGWSFGDLLRGGFLWTGNQGVELAAEFYIDDFYRLTFADGREEAFLLALAEEGLSDLRRLEALAAAHRLETRLTAADTPADLRPAAIQAAMRDLMRQISIQDGIDELLTVLDVPTVLAIGSPALTADLVQAAWDQGDYDYALEMIEALEEQAATQPEAYQKLMTLQADIYRDWLERLMARRDYSTALEVYQAASDRFPQDPAIYLAGVELALADQDWALAEQLLAQRRYPPQLRDKVSRLRNEITDLKAQEGKIVISEALA